MKDAMCFAKFISYYYIGTKSIKEIEIDCHPIVLDEDLMKSDSVKCIYATVIPLMSAKESFKGRNLKAVWQYHQPSPNRDIEKFAHHMLLFFYSFRVEEYLKLQPITGIYLENRQKPGVLDVINRNRAMMEPLSDVVDNALMNLQSNLDAFLQQKSAENKKVIAVLANDFLDNENPSDGARGY